MTQRSYKLTVLSVGKGIRTVAKDRKLHLYHCTISIVYRIRVEVEQALVLSYLQ